MKTCSHKALVPRRGISLLHVIYAKRINPAVDRHVLETDMLAFMKKIQGDAFENDKVAENHVDAVTENHVHGE